MPPRALTRVVTLAPERDEGFAVTRMLAAQGIVVSAGHTDATLDELRAAIDAGLSMFTHVGNGCPMHMHRHDNIVQRALSLAGPSVVVLHRGRRARAVCRTGQLSAAGRRGRCVIVTDAIAPAGLGPGRYKLGRWDIVVDEDMVPRAPDRSHFVGSAVTMKQSANNLREALRLPDGVVRRLTCDNPRSVIGV